MAKSARFEAGHTDQHRFGSAQESAEGVRFCWHSVKQGWRGWPATARGSGCVIANVFRPPRVLVGSGRGQSQLPPGLDPKS